MNILPFSVVAVIAALTVFLCLVLVLKYAVGSDFVRTRAVMSLFFWFVVVTLTISFWDYKFDTLPYVVPAGFLGMLVGHVVGVQEARRKLAMQGLNYYMEHFAHVHFKDLEHLNWWALINFYSVAGALVLINFVGLSNVIFGGSRLGAIITSAVGAFLLGTIFPYLAHLWTIKTAHHTKRITSVR